MKVIIKKFFKRQDALVVVLDSGYTLISKDSFDRMLVNAPLNTRAIADHYAIRINSLVGYENLKDIVIDGSTLLYGMDTVERHIKPLEEGDYDVVRDIYKEMVKTADPKYALLKKLKLVGIDITKEQLDNLITRAEINLTYNEVDTNFKKIVNLLIDRIKINMYAGIPLQDILDKLATIE